MTTQKQTPVGKSKSLMEAMEKYKATGNNEFFTLEDDGDTAIVRFLYTNAEELDWFVVHEVEIGGKKRWVQCSEEADCPCCLKVKKPSLKLFIQLIQKGKEDTVMTWERGQKFIPQIMELFEAHGDLTQHIFEIERKGKKGDSNTKYAIHHIGESKVDTDDLLERQEFLGPDGFVLQKTHAEMKEILSGNFQYQKVENPAPRREAKKDVEVF
jgi:hypothetical protein